MKENKCIAIVVSIAIFAITAALYARTVHFPFAVIDDALYVFSNNHVIEGLSAASIKWAFTTFHASNWHPVTWMSLMVDSQLFGLNPIGYHAVNILLHALNASLLFLLFYKMTGAVLRSAFVAACFAFHPLHVESVVWITERKDVLSFFFFMLTMLCYIEYVRCSRRFWYLSSLIVFAIGLMAKPMLVTVPLVLLLIDYWPLGRYFAGDKRIVDSDNLTHLLVEKIPFFLLAALSSWVTVMAQHDSIRALEHLSLPDRVSNALWSTITYMRKTVLPYDLAMFYPYNQVPYAKAVFAAVLLCAISFLVVKCGRKSPYLMTGWLWFLITLLPIIGLIQVGSQAMADRYTYIPLVGLFIIVSWGGKELCEKRAGLRLLLQTTAAATVLVLALLTWVQTGFWGSNVMLAEHAIAVTEQNSFAHFCLGRAYEWQERPDLAVAQYQEALKINNRDAESHVNLGALLNNQGMSLEAIEHFGEAIRLTPNFAEAHFGLGVAYTKTDMLDDAIKEYYAAAMLEPDNVMYINNLGATLAQRGRLDEAIRQFSRVLELSPTDIKARDNIELAIRQKADQNKFGALDGR